MEAVKKIISYSLSLAFLFSLLFPSQAVFNLAHASVASQVQAGQIRQALKPQFSIKVVSAAPTEKISTSQPAFNLPLPVNCKFSAGSSANLVQNALAVNLNQPADCFSFVAARPQSEALSIAVQVTVLPSQAVVVVSNPLAIQAPSLNPAPFAQNSPVLPLAGSVAVAGLGVLQKRVLVKALKMAKNLKFNLSLQQLQVLRC